MTYFKMLKRFNVKSVTKQILVKFTKTQTIRNIRLESFTNVTEKN